MGGTFNPIHNGHIQIALAASKAFFLEQILFLPSGMSYMKREQKIADASHRIHMTQLAIADYPDFSVSTMETDRGGNTYTYETLELLRQQNPTHHYYFIVGADSLFNIENWRYPEKIFANCTILAANRGDTDYQQFLDKKEDLMKRFHADIELFQMTPIPVSSTMIRECCTQGKSIDDYVPQSVAHYIQDNHLYK